MTDNKNLSNLRHTDFRNALRAILILIFGEDCSPLVNASHWAGEIWVKIALIEFDNNTVTLVNRALASYGLHVIEWNFGGTNEDTTINVWFNLSPIESPLGLKTRIVYTGKGFYSLLHSVIAASEPMNMKSIWCDSLSELISKFQLINQDYEIA